MSAVVSFPEWRIVRTPADIEERNRFIRHLGGMYGDAAVAEAFDEIIWAPLVPLSESGKQSARAIAQRLGIEIREG